MTKPTRKNEYKARSGDNVVLKVGMKVYNAQADEFKLKDQFKITCFGLNDNKEIVVGLMGVPIAVKLHTLFIVKQNVAMYLAEQAINELLDEAQRIRFKMERHKRIIQTFKRSLT